MEILHLQEDINLYKAVMRRPRQEINVILLHLVSAACLSAQGALRLSGLNTTS